MRKLFSTVFSAVLLLIVSAPVTWAQRVKFYDLGHYPGGTWAEPRDINNSGVVVAFGDVPPNFYTHPIGVPIFGPQAGQWFDLGTLGGDRSDTEVMCMGIADTGMIVGHSAIAGNEIVHAFAWTPKSGMVDIGTLADLGPRYSGYNFSLAEMTNNSGNLIVGWSGSTFMGPDSLPVVWTPKVVWTSGRPTTTWKIDKLDTKGFEGASGWLAPSVNNSGQIIGTATTADGVQIAVLWNPLPRGEGWKIMQLPVPVDYPNAEPSDINDRGEIVGLVASPDWGIGLPALWKKKSPLGNTWKLTLLPNLAGPLQTWGEADGINDLGDIVGGSCDANWSWLATRWSTGNPNFVQKLDLAESSGESSEALKVNDNGVAAGWYGNATVTENTAAWKFR